MSKPIYFLELMFVWWFVTSWPLRERWFWLLFGFLLLLFILPFLIIYIIISLPPWIVILFIIAVVLVWACVKGYRDYVSKG